MKIPILSMFIIDRNALGSVRIMLRPGKGLALNAKENSNRCSGVA